MATSGRKPVPIYEPANCLAGDVAGAVVYVTGDISNNRLQVATCDPTDPAKRPPVGVIVQKQASTECVVQGGGLALGLYSGLTPGAEVFVAADGTPTTTPPSGIPQVRIGIAVASDSICFMFPGEHINDLPEKVGPANADVLVIEDSADGYARKKVQVGNLPGGGGGGTDLGAETLTYTDTVNKVVGPLGANPSDVGKTTIWAIDGIVQEYTTDYTVRQVSGGSAPGYYICIATDSTAPGGGSFVGGSNPTTGIDAILASADLVRVIYPTP